LQTIAKTVDTVFKQHPGAWIYAIGSNKARTRLYRIVISNNLNTILSKFEILGLRNNEWEKFRKDVDYSAFLLHRNNLNLHYE
jgi:hypothetical protein